MNLYFKPGACSLSPHILIRELGLDVELSQVKDGKLKDGTDYKTVNPKGGAVPALRLNDGTVLTEGAVIVQYLADQKPGNAVLPAAGTIGRYRVQEWLNYVATELHAKLYSPLFNPKASEEAKAALRERLAAQMQYLSTQLEGKAYLMGEQFTVADGYLFTVLTWSSHVKVDLAQWPVVKAYFDRIMQRPSVKAALEAEREARKA